MKEFTTADRLKQIIKERGIRQVDIIEACKPFCERYGVFIKKNDLSQYISGKVMPKQDKLTILSLALNVNEVWLMGYDVPADVNYAKQGQNNNLSSENTEQLFEQIEEKLGNDACQVIKLFLQLDMLDRGAAMERIRVMLEDKKYSKQKESKHA